MERKGINYCDVLKLGFTETLHEDIIYFEQHGFPYSIIVLQLNARRHIYWNKSTRFASLEEIGKDHEVLNRTPIYTLEDLKAIISIHLNWKKEFLKCINSPYYFFTRYISQQKSSIEEVITSLEKEFNDSFYKGIEKNENSTKTK